MSLADVRKSNRRTWLCKCDCGNFREVTTHELCGGNVTSCGCGNSRSYPYRELSGQRFGRLTVIEKTEKRSEKGSVLWRCRCECGKEKLFSEDALVHGNCISCDCYRETELPKKLNARLHHVDGTCVEFLQQKKRVDNTTGHTGVYRTRDGKFKVDITFKKKRYHLGVFETLEEAVRTRKRGEEMHEEFLVCFYKTHQNALDRRENLGH